MSAIARAVVSVGFAVLLAACGASQAGSSDAGANADDDDDKRSDAGPSSSPQDAATGTGSLPPWNVEDLGVATGVSGRGNLVTWTTLDAVSKPAGRRVHEGTAAPKEIGLSGWLQTVGQGAVVSDRLVLWRASTERASNGERLLGWNRATGQPFGDDGVFCADANGGPYECAPFAAAGARAAAGTGAKFQLLDVATGAKSTGLTIGGKTFEAFDLVGCGERLVVLAGAAGSTAGQPACDLYALDPAASAWRRLSTNNFRCDDGNPLRTVCDETYLVYMALVDPVKPSPFLVKLDAPATTLAEWGELAASSSLLTPSRVVRGQLYQRVGKDGTDRILRWDLASKGPTTLHEGSFLPFGVADDGSILLFEFDTRSGAKSVTVIGADGKRRSVGWPALAGSPSSSASPVYGALAHGFQDVVFSGTDAWWVAERAQIRSLIHGRVPPP